MLTNGWLEVIDYSADTNPVTYAQKGRYKGVIVCMGEDSDAILTQLSGLHLHRKSKFLFIKGLDRENQKMYAAKFCKSPIPFMVWDRDNYPLPYKSLLSKTIYPTGVNACLVCSGENEAIKTLISHRGTESFCLCGYQTYLCSPELLKKLSKQNMEMLRLGSIRDDICSIEPVMRDKELFLIDFNCMRHSDFPLSPESGNPNGLYAEEICHVARYIGLSLGKRNIFLTDSTIAGKNHAMLPAVCYRLIAQTILHVCLGICDNTVEDPHKADTSENFAQKIVKLYDNQQEIEFISSLITGRWWMKIPILTNESYRYVSCSKEEYETACKGELPMKWLIFYQKYNLK